VRDHRHAPAAPGRSFLHVFCGCPRPEPLVDLGLYPAGPRDRLRRLEGTQQGAREHRVEPFGRQLLAERARRLLPVGGQGAELVRLARLGLGMADEVKAHRVEDTLPDVDYQVFHAVNAFVAGHAWLGREAAAFEGWSVPVYAVLTVGLWLLARPGGDRRWKLASASALGASALALGANQAIARLWTRARPFAAHPSAHVWGPRSHDPSFPSDHASAAFAIAWSVLLYDRAAGALFLLAAATIGVGRVVVGVHYPGDVLAGVLVGLGCALLVHRATGLVRVGVSLVERATDPVLRRML
jgi:membrane-associated phospholipid phosphatase